MKSQIISFFTPRNGNKINGGTDDTSNPLDSVLHNLFDSEEEFRNSLMSFINEAIGKRQWAIHFHQQPSVQAAEKFIVKIYCQTKEQFEQIADVVKEKVAGKNIFCDYMGSVDL